MAQAFADMDALEKGAIANPDEKRRVGHYWIRTPELSPTPTISTAITEAIAAIMAFAQKIHAGQIQGAHGSFTDLLCVGIGGSALGPQFVADAL